MTPTPVAGKFCATVPETIAEICLTNLTETVGKPLTYAKFILLFL